MHSRTHACTHTTTRTHSRTHAHRQEYARTHVHARMHTRTHARTHAHMHARTHTHTLYKLIWGERKWCISEEFGEEKCLQFAFEGRESSRVPAWCLRGDYSRCGDLCVRKCDIYSYGFSV